MNGFRAPRPRSRPRALPCRTPSDERGQSMAEFAIVMPFLLLLVFGIIELGAAWRTYQVITNTAREGARIAVIPGKDENDVRTAVDARLTQGGLDPAMSTVEIVCDAGAGNCFNPTGRTGTGTEVRITYPYTFLFLGPITDFVTGGGGDAFGTITMRTGILMRNE